MQKAAGLIGRLASSAGRRYLVGERKFVGGKMEEAMDTVTDALSAVAGRDWETIRKASAAAAEAKQRLITDLAGLVSQEDMSVVVFGSLARNELTSGSDVDWTLLIDGQASSTHFEVARQIRKKVEASSKGPGREATFGGFAFSHDILHRIGGGEDTNRNLTQRTLLLLESAALGPAEAHGRVLHGVLHRYITEDAGWDAKSVSVPRFLLNDIARYWRTVAVDFAYKRRERETEGWALRTVKLRLSRKLTFASGLLACFSCALSEAVRDAEDRSSAVIDHLLAQVKLNPLERIAGVLLHQNLVEPATTLFDSYERFLALIDDKQARDHLDELPPDQARADEVYGRAREIGHAFQAALDEIFFKENGTRIPELTRSYGVF
jgi:predicted nucleotidyltransferase